MVALPRVAVLLAALAASGSQAQSVAQTSPLSPELKAFHDCMCGGSGSASNESLALDDNFFVEASVMYDDYATGPKARIDRKPAGVFFATSEDDVVRAVTCAVASDLSPVPRSGGHSYEVLSSMDGSLVIDMADMVEVNILSEDEDEGSALVTVQGGARLGYIYTELDRLGNYNFNAGTCPGVGIGGHVTGGGYGIVAREYGLAADQTVEMRVALHDGSVVTASASESTDLFWALRGGGAGSFGIVTLFTIKVYRVPEVSLFNIKFNGTKSAEVLRQWMDFFPEADSKLTTQLVVSHSGTTIVGQYLGSKLEMDEVLNASGLFDLDAVTEDTRRDDCSQMAAKAFIWNGNCEDLSAFNVSRHMTLADKDYTKIKGGYGNSPLSDEGVQVVLDWEATIPNTTWAYVQFEAYGGVFASQSNDLTPWAHRDAVWSVQYGIGTLEDEPETSPAYDWIRSFEEALAPYMDGGNYQNYCDLDLGDDFGVLYWGAENYARLRDIKAEYDPLNVFHSAQSIALP